MRRRAWFILPEVCDCPIPTLDSTAEQPLVNRSALNNHHLRNWTGSTEVTWTTLQVDTSVNFDQVGGLDHYLKQLNEMVFLPLVYPELFECFHLTPPRGVLFHGPPGTGKTLVARALAATASKAGRKVSKGGLLMLL